MGLREMVMEEYKIQKDQERKENLKQAEDFSVKAINILKERIGNEFSIDVIAKEPFETIFDVDGIIFRVDNRNVFVIKKCEKCGKEYQENVMNRFNHEDQRKVLADIGKKLSEPHNEFDCKMVLEEKNENKGQTTEERLLSALEDFVYEYSRDFGSF